jgi:protein-disulfide isomerase
MSKKKNEALVLISTIFICSLMICGSLIFLGLQLAKNGSSNGTGITETNRTDSLSEYFAAVEADTANDDAVMGNLESSVSIIEYSDYQCPFCRSFFTGAYSEIKSEYVETNLVSYSFKDFPLDFHKDAIFAANAAECARAEGDDKTYFDFHDALFTVQGPASNGTVAITDKMITDIAKDLDVNSKNFQSCLEDKTFYAEIAADLLASEQATANRIAEFNPDTREIEIRETTAEEKTGVNATPTFFINDIKIVGAQPIEVFKFAIDSELNK